MMKKKPVPILILSSILDSANGFRALKNGALEVMKKPDIDQFNNPAFYRDFILKIKTLATVPVRGKTASTPGTGIQP